MKISHLLLLSTFLASCNSAMTISEGTSSETQTALQALADNMQMDPGSPGQASSNVAGRMTESGGECSSASGWTNVGWLQFERYDGALKPNGDTSDNSWESVRNELATDASGNRIDACATGPMTARARHSWRTKHGVLAEFDGRFLRRSDTGGMQRSVWTGGYVFPSGFRLGRVETVASVGRDVLLARHWDPDTMVNEYTFFDGRYSFVSDHRDLRSLLYDSATLEEIREAHRLQQPWYWCVPIRDLRASGRPIGAACTNILDSKWMSNWIVRDADGKEIKPRDISLPSVDDSMGVRVLSSRWDGDSLRIGIHVQTAPFALSQWSMTSIAVTDSAYQWLPEPERLGSIVFPDTNFVGPRVAEIVLPRGILTGRAVLWIHLLRNYWNPNTPRFLLGSWSIRIPDPL